MLLNYILQPANNLKHALYLCKQWRNLGYNYIKAPYGETSLVNYNEYLYIPSEESNNISLEDVYKYFSIMDKNPNIYEVINYKKNKNNYYFALLPSYS